MTTPKNDHSLLHTPLNRVKGVGPATHQKLIQFGIHNLLDALFHLPLRYEDRTQITSIDALESDQTALVEGEVIQVSPIPGQRLNLVLSDQTGELTLRFFHTYASLRRMMRRGVRLRCFGTVNRYQGRLQMVHPEVRLLKEGDSPSLDQALTPIYPTVSGLHQSIWRNLMRHALSLLQNNPQALPELLLPSFTVGKMSLIDALHTLHRPTPEMDQKALLSGEHPAIRRLAFEELLAHRLSLRRMGEIYREEKRSPQLSISEERLRNFLTHLPYQLTSAQERAWKEIALDLSKETPMLRLLQGDVGSGKTVVAALAALSAASQGYQAALMAPTELLAEQHIEVLQKMFQPLGVAVGGLLGSMREREKRESLAQIESGTLQVVVGTHALFQSGVSFARLGVIIVDEQHRFGVAQRLALKNKGEDEHSAPHQLIMTATPIPRSLAMIGYADLDSSVIDALPPGRIPITTVVLPNDRRAEMIERVKQQCAQGRQAYWVCTIIEESEKLTRQAAETLAEELKEALAPLKVALIHGRLKAAEKEEKMLAFKEQEIDLLVATTVIEVGVDVPNASLMIIENAECLGLAQLHQLRGRVGRGNQESYCVLLYQAPLSSTARARLATLRQTEDGFLIAQKDLELRGPGELLGTRQTGVMAFKIADLGRDQWMVDEVITTAEELLKESPEQAEQLVRRWLEGRHHYAQV